MAEKKKPAQASPGLTRINRPADMSPGEFERRMRELIRQEQEQAFPTRYDQRLPPAASHPSVTAADTGEPDTTLARPSAEQVAGQAADRARFDEMSARFAKAQRTDARDTPGYRRPRPSVEKQERDNAAAQESVRSRRGE
mgnify:CR=1 FL=1